MEFKEVNLDGEEAGDQQKVATPVEPNKEDAKVPSVSNSISVQIIPEKKGNFIKHTEYSIRSEKYNCTVDRRYNDFLLLHENLMKVYEYRVIPRLPPKQFMLDAFLEERRAGLQRWLIIVSQHALISKDILLRNFLTEGSFTMTNISSEYSDFLSRKIQSLKLTEVDEVHRKQKMIRTILNNLLTLKRIMREQLKRENSQAEDFTEMCQVLNDLMDLTSDASLKDFTANFEQVPRVTENNKGTGAVEQLELILEVLIGYDDACNRVLSLNDDDDDMFNKQKFRNLLRSMADDDTDVRHRRLLFGMSCVIEEFKIVQNYLKLLPSILLKFTYQESQTYSQLARIFQAVLDIESDKLN